MDEVPARGLLHRTDVPVEALVAGRRRHRVRDGHRPHDGVGGAAADEEQRARRAAGEGCARPGSLALRGGAFDRPLVEDALALGAHPQLDLVRNAGLLKHDVDDCHRVLGAPDREGG